ncbi:clasp N terminal-domain-containing protein [Talaromyces proteolyticus]|uniref:Clasp N terminal-domain-containing protein n=1 Tax=Talaromyces proteolyticus TaxID=1131652 RepID=A0AAD4PWR1_9EURO|nr:clasp N terminal-domain-containing protein [Talaromyces proteolyticus]KAH8698412.1 clasp N terminal-domain-containing protein [Talaromyces proteolyticus]
MESRASELLVALKNPNTSVDSKIAGLTNLKSDIKQKNVPEAAVLPIFESIRVAISAQHSSLSSAGFSTLGHLLKRLYIQEFHSLVAFHARQIYSICLERLGDHKERLRSQAAQAFTDLWLAAPQEVEQNVLGVALVGKNPRAKEMSMIWLATMTREHNILFRTHVPSLVTALEDADSGVRECAKNTVIEIFQTAPSRAKSDLKKQLSENGVRKSIVSAILSGLGVSDHDAAPNGRSESRRPGSSLAVSRHRDDPPRPNSVLSARPQSRVGIAREDSDISLHPHPKVDKHISALSHSASIDSLAASASAAIENEDVEPLYVDSNREIDDMVRDMSYHFEGRESEQNWIHREKSIETLRRLVRGNAPQSFSQHFLAGIKSLLDGILKVVNSLRTTLSTGGCLLIQEIAKTCGPAIDHMVEMLLQNMIKVCAGMKKISAQNGNTTVDVIIQNVTYVPRILQHLCFACQDKNVQPRLYATGWLKSLLIKQARHKSSIEHGGGLDLVEKCIKKCLSDPNPGVRESMRGTYWTFYKIWPDRADEIMSTLDTKSKSLLEKDPSNPNATVSSDSRPRAGLSSSVSASSQRQALKETIAAQKRAAAAKNIPPRPESAQSAFADSKPTRPPSRTPASKTTTSSSTVRVPTGSHLSSLSSAPMRPGVKPRRPEITRPATADPYADRRPPSAASHLKTFSPDVSPAKPRTKSVTTPSTKSPARPKSRTGLPPVSSTRRLDISSLKSSDSRPGPKSDPEDVVQLARDNEIAEPGLHEDSQAAEQIIMNQNYAPESTHVAAMNDEIGAVEDRHIIENDAPVIETQTASYTQMAHSRTNSTESRVTASAIGSPHARHSRHGSEDKASKIPSPVAPRIVYHNDTRHESRHEPRHEPRLGGLTVYEDPEAQQSLDKTLPGNEDTALVDHRKPVLEEIPVNEPNTPAPRDNKQITIPSSTRAETTLPSDGSENTRRTWGKIEVVERRRSISPRSKDLTKAKEMIDKGIIRVKAKALDVHGYRKLQGLIKYHGSIFSDESKYDEMLLALLDALEAPSDDKRSPASRSMDLKTQILVTIRLMFAYNETYFTAYYPRIMTSLLNTRKQYDLTNHIVSGLEETAEDIVASCQPEGVMSAVLDLVEAEKHDDEGYRAITMGIYVLTGLLHRLNKHQKKLNEPEITRLGKFGNTSLSQPQPDVRRAVTEYCVELHEMMHDEEAFWRMINSAGNDHRNLLTYFIAKKASASHRSD